MVAGTARRLPVVAALAVGAGLILTALLAPVFSAPIGTAAPSPTQPPAPSLPTVPRGLLSGPTPAGTEQFSGPPSPGPGRAFQDENAEVYLAPGQSYSGSLDWCAFSTNTVDIVGYASASGDAADFTSPDYLESGDLTPGACSSASYTVTAPDEGGNYSLVWSLGCFAADGSGCDWEGPATVTILVVVTSDAAATETEVDCEPSTVAQEVSTTCTATVTSSGSETPTGEVSWTTESPEGSFDTSPCELIDGSCSTGYTDGEVGNWTITAEYSGDANSQPSEGSTEVTITPAASGTTTTALSCDPTSFIVSSGYTECTATVSGTDPTGVIDWQSSSANYEFDPASCSAASCTVDYIDYVTGTPTLTAYYRGDTNNLPSEGSTVVTVTQGTQPTTTSVSCDPPSVEVGSSTTCTATVSGAGPTGTVIFDASPSDGVFEPVLCTLSVESATQSSCGADFAPSVAETVTVTATYTGDSSNEGSAGSTDVTVFSNAQPTSTEVECIPNPVLVGDSATCTASVSGNDPTGTVDWSEVGLDGSFSDGSCGLSSSSCSSDFTASDAGSGTIVASYLGDDQNEPSSGVTALNATTTIVTSYSVTFEESGLADGTSWSVTLDASTGDSTTPTIAFTEPNGSYPFTVGSVSGYSADPASGLVVVNGADVGVPIAFTPTGASTYLVSFVESGLPTGTTWSVTLEGTSQTSSSPEIDYEEPNGSYSYSVGTVDGYSAEPSTGGITVAGTPVETSVTFTSTSETTYPVNFTESGLPSGTLWSVTLGSDSGSSTTPRVDFEEPNGSYSYAIAAVSGYSSIPSSGAVQVDGAGVSVSVQFMATTGTSYAVIFAESGLATGTTWSITLNGQDLSSTTTSIDFAEVNGSHAYLVGGLVGYTADPSSGIVVVQGSLVEVAIAFTATHGDLYAIAFTETGLASGTSWAVTLDSSTQSTTTDTVTFGAADGTFGYSVTPVAGYTASPGSGSVTVAGGPAWVAITFTPTGTPAYAVSFTESGLPAGRTWSVTLSGATQSSTTATVAFVEANGPHPFSVGGVSGYVARPPSGTVSVSGAAVSVTIAFASQGPGTYAVRFNETGLPNGSRWNVTVASVKESSTSPNITFELANGQYDYAVDPVGPWYPVIRPNGTFTVASAPLAIPITFAFTSPVTIPQSGIPAGTPWMVEATLTALPARAQEGLVGMSWFANSTGVNALLHLVNGTYTATITSPGYQTTSTSPFTVNGLAKTLPPTGVTPNPSPSTAWWVLAAVAGAVAVVVIVVVVLLVVRRRPRTGGPPVALTPPRGPASRRDSPTRPLTPRAGAPAQVVSPSPIAPACPRCSQPLLYVGQYGRYYCGNCRQYR